MAVKCGFWPRDLSLSSVERARREAFGHTWARFCVTLATDLPMHVCTSIGREYAIATALGFSRDDLMMFTRNAVAASFTTATRRASLFDELASYVKRT